MQKKGLEPSRYCYHTDLNRARLPIPPLLLINCINWITNSYNYITILPAINQALFYIYKCSLIRIKKEPFVKDSFINAGDGT